MKRTSIKSRSKGTMELKNVVSEKRRLTLATLTKSLIWAWERVTVLTPQIVAKRDTRNIFPVGLPRGPHGFDSLIAPVTG
uniref:Uncharacterized protein n=1 Tax=Solanum lycopersicum TaxID=4081 RepID=A0A494G8A7_SOLLC